MIGRRSAREVFEPGSNVTLCLSNSAKFGILSRFHDSLFIKKRGTEWYFSLGSARAGIRTRVDGMKTRNDGPCYTTRALTSGHAHPS